jgi:hypothetical protein
LTVLHLLYFLAGVCDQGHTNTAPFLYNLILAAGTRIAISRHHNHFDHYLPLFNFKMVNARVQTCEYNGSIVEIRRFNCANVGVTSMDSLIFAFDELDQQVSK